MRSAATCGHGKPRRDAGVKKGLTLNAAVPRGHGGARQALAELRRIVDAEWQRIRGILIPKGQRFDGKKARADDVQRLVRGVGQNLMTDALAVVRVRRKLLRLRRLGVLCRLAATPLTAHSKRLRRVACQHEQAHEG